VFATDDNFKQGPGPWTNAKGGFLLVAENDICLGTQRFEFGNFDTLSIKFNNVQSATLSGTATVTDIADPTAPERSYSVALLFAATGAIESGTGHFNIHFPGGQTVFHSEGFFTVATATGSVTATATAPAGNVISGLTGTGTLDQHRQGAVQIIRA
jgi:hypothetical protein